MYRILMGISRELSNIKQIMSEEGEEMVGPLFWPLNYIYSFFAIYL